MELKKRLEPWVFKVPIDKIRAGYYTDKYFLRVSEILEKENHNPRVMYQFFVREPVVVVGIDEAIAILKFCTGYYSDREAADRLYKRLREVQYNLYRLTDQGPEETIAGLHVERARIRQELNRLWVNCWNQIRVRALFDGDRVEPWEPLMIIEGPQQYFAYLETVLLGVIARPTATATATAEVVGAAQGKPILFFPARFDHFWVQATDGYAAMKAGAFGVSTDANADYWGDVGVGTIPHCLIAAYGGSTVEASLAFDRQIEDSVNRVVLVDWDNDCIGTTLQVINALYDKHWGVTPRDLKKAVGPGKHKIWGIRFDTSGNLRDKSVAPHDEHSLGVCPELVHKAREVFDAHGLQDLKIVASGGFNAARIELFEKLQVPVDSYGVGSSLLQKKIDVTADVVEVDGKPCAKVGRKKGDLSRLAPVD
ncbi:MAG: nicotinate phosphoribosyltransferase [Candidatus Tectomicrobia bacterium]|uniref:nicotinate phosphoribosyltransferase n=1 Tax=Tectimicrobiota bacterium TaxID=2528274 RepID=A0A932M0Z0_UNCTE|nr:nicotinate phosphoribosyltransferase [Candidatus Tectomicrobia bacterium]